MAILLEARGITKHFPGVRALKGVDFDLLPGEVHALVGENGAGKSTLVNILTGVLQPDNGTIAIQGQSTNFASPHEARGAGIRVIHQELAFVPYLDVATNLSLGEIPVRPGLLSRLCGGLVDREALRQKAARALATVGTPVPAGITADRLSVAQAQLLEIARALSSRFRIFLLDEPTSSIGPAERDELFGHIRSLRAAGVGVLYISHRLEEILELADRVTVLRDGAIVGTYPVSELSIDRIVELMTGTSRRAEAVPHSNAGAVVLEVRGLSRAPVLRNVSLSVRAGEVVGLAGLVGAGRTELARCIFGVDPFDQGEILLDSRPIRPRGPHEALNLGIGYATEDRKGAGVFHDRPVRDNILLGPLARASLARTVVGGFSRIRGRAVRDLVADMIRRLDVRPPRAETLAGKMSGGNQQKVVLARLIASQPRVLILDEPTRGIDVGTKREIWRLIRQLADSGVAILAISSDIPEFVGNADRVVVMRRGTIAGELPGAEVSETEVMRYAV